MSSRPSSRRCNRASSRSGTRLTSIASTRAGWRPCPRSCPDPSRRVFSYGEAVVMGDPLMQDISDIENSKPDWYSILGKHGVDCVIERPDSPLGMTLSVEPGWVRVYNDDFAEIFVRQ